MIVCIDVGGEHTRIAISEDSKSFIVTKKFETPPAFETLIETIKKEFDFYAKDVKQVSIGQAGTIDRTNGIITWWGQRPWTGKNFFLSLADKFPSANFFMENDASLAGLGEAVYGAGRNYSIVGYLTLSSGVGGAIITDKKIASHKYGFEPGHQIINTHEEEVWSCGQRGCFESYASGTAFKKIFGIAGEDCHDPQIWEKYALNLAPGVANTIAMWSPEIIILGGGISQKADYFLGILNYQLKKLLPFEIPKITHAELPDPALYGGLSLSK